jgi:hypothetical protein
VDTFSITGYADPFTPELVDLSDYDDVTRVEVVDITDGGGIGYDDIRFLVPE